MTAQEFEDRATGNRIRVSCWEDYEFVKFLEWINPEHGWFKAEDKYGRIDTCIMGNGFDLDKNDICWEQYIPMDSFARNEFEGNVAGKRITWPTWERGDYIVFYEWADKETGLFKYVDESESEGIMDMRNGFLPCLDGSSWEYYTARRR